ncbi:MAG: hypothetical protein AAGF97_09125, partial [Planctomycetota bacterium]
SAPMLDTSGGTGISPVQHESEAPQSIPNNHGQVWKQYNISPYTARVDSPHPEQAIVDWILRETGTELWFTEPFGFLSANRDTLTVYHTREVQQIVSNIVNRFVGQNAADFAFGVRMVTVANPNWRAKAMPRLQPVPVQSPGMEAWLMSREDAAVVLDDLRRRSDFREHSSPNLVIRNGEDHEIKRQRPLTYVKGMNRDQLGAAGYRMEMGQVDEGFALNLSPLLSLDRTTIDAVIKLETTQVEQLTPITVQTPSMANPRQTTKIEVPQTASWRLHERFRWPANQVLLISCGVVATPGPDKSSGLNLTRALSNNPPRADALLLVAAKGRVTEMVTHPAQPREATSRGFNFRGRY